MTTLINVRLDGKTKTYHDISTNNEL